MKSSKSQQSSTDSLPILIVLSGLLIALRPTMIPLVAFLGLVALVLLVRKRRAWTPAPVAMALVLVALQGLILAARDRMLSGWLQFPLSIYSFDVPWRAADPTGLREATLGYARDPGNWQDATSGWSWVGPWLSRLPGLWDPWLFLAVVISGGALMLLARARGVRLRRRAFLSACAPFLAAIAVWFVFSPPAFRFGWAPLFGLAAIVAGWGVWAMRWTNICTAVAGLALGVVAVASFFVRLDTGAFSERGSWLGIGYRYSALPSPAVEEVELQSGLGVLVPVSSDQCWDVYPLCTPQPIPSLRAPDGPWPSGLVP